VHLIDVVAIAGSLGILTAVVVLTASGRLKPRYALLWLFAAAVLVVVSVWRSLIDDVGTAFGVVYKPALLFLGADVFLMLILLHMSVVVSRLTERTRRLAQELALLRSAVEEGADRGDARGRPELPPGGGRE